MTCSFRDRPKLGQECGSSMGFLCIYPNRLSRYFMLPAAALTPMRSAKQEYRHRLQLASQRKQKVSRRSCGKEMV